jgi:2-methylcitrate dehydratase PrpD
VTTPLRDTISDFIVAHHEISDDLREIMRTFIADFLAVTEGGSNLPSSVAARHSIRTSGEPDSTHTSLIFGTSLWARSDDVALVNGISGHGLELDDTHEPSSSHPGVVVMSAVLALASELDSLWEDTLTAIVLGYDVMGVLGVYVGAQETYDRGFHPTAVAGAVGAAAACSRLRRLGRKEAAEAISLAANMAAGSLEFLADGSWTKRLNAGHAASVGLKASALAAAGFEGPSTALEGPRGFAIQYGHGVTAGRSFELEFGAVARETSLKFFPCCRYMHGAMDLLALYQAENPRLDLTTISEIEVAVITAGRALVSDPSVRKLEIRTSVDAQFSMPFGAAACLSWGRVGPDVFNNAAQNAETLLPLMRTVVCVSERSIDDVYPRRWAARVSITFKDGRRDTRKESAFLGSPSNPASTQQLREKAESLVGEARSKALEKATSSIEALSFVRAWSEALRA